MVADALEIHRSPPDYSGNFSLRGSSQSCELDYRTNNLPAVEHGNRSVDLIQRNAPAYQALDVELAQAPQVKQAREVPHWISRTVAGTYQLTFHAEDLAGAEIDLRVRAASSDNYDVTTSAGSIPSCPDGLGPSDDFECIVEADALRQVLDQVGKIGGPNEVGGAKLFGNIELGFERIDRDNFCCTSEPCTLNDIEAHPATPEDYDRGPGYKPCRVDDCADTCRHTAADQRSDVQRQVVVDFDRGRGRYDHLLRERTP